MAQVAPEERSGDAARFQVGAVVDQPQVEAPPGPVMAPVLEVVRPEADTIEAHRAEAGDASTYCENADSESFADLELPRPSPLNIDTSCQCNNRLCHHI